jgi:hypothetical protein
MTVPTLTGFAIMGLFHIPHPKRQKPVISIACYVNAETDAVNKTKLHLMRKKIHGKSSGLTPDHCCGFSFTVLVILTLPEIFTFLKPFKLFKSCKSLK